MTERLMGVETEYAFIAFRKDGSVADARQTMTQIERLAEKRLPHLPARAQRGSFLQNASRFYRDFGGHDAHQEMTTPECPNPWDAVRYVVANEQMRWTPNMTGRSSTRATSLSRAMATVAST